MKKRIISLFAAILLFAAAIPLFSACKKSVDDRDDKYVVLMLTNKHWEEGVEYMQTMKNLYGETDPATGRLYAAGFIGPMLLTQSVTEMKKQVNDVFDAAEKYNVPVYFQLDDCNNYSTLFGSGATTKFYEDPEMCEWVDFPAEGESYGGERYGMLPRFWFNWSVWTYSQAFPNFASQKLRDFVVANLKEGFIKPMKARYEKLIKAGKAYLYAGCAVGWETHIPDYSVSNTMLNMSPSTPPKDVLTGNTMQAFEFAQYGYGALHSLGYDRAKLESEAAALSKDVNVYIKEILFGVIHDYTELLAKTVCDAGVPQRKIFTHTVGHHSTKPESSNYCTFFPPMWVAVNDYSTPGYTMSPVTCPYNLNNAVARIKAADPEQDNLAIAEGYAAGFDTVAKAETYFTETFGAGGRLITAFGFGDTGSRLFPFELTNDFPYTVALNSWLDGDI